MQGVSKLISRNLNAQYAGFFMGAHMGWDNGGRRSGVERRSFTYSMYIPENRSGKERRSGIDRRETQLSADDLAKERRVSFFRAACLAIQRNATKCRQF